MAKETINLLVKGGAASGSPPLGPALGPMGIPIDKVVGAINEKTAAMKGMDVPVKVIVDTEAKTFEDLPSNARDYVCRVEEFIGKPITMIGVGPKRSQSIFR